MERATPEDKAIFEKLETFSKKQIYQQKNEQSEIQSFAASFNKNNFGNSFEIILKRTRYPAALKK